MSRKMMILVLMVTLSAIAGDKRGAKALFVDGITGAEVSTGSNRQPSGNSTGRVRGTTNVDKPVPPAVELTGLLYYVEVLYPNGEKKRVSADRVFRSGERILLHVVSGTDGDIVIYQRGPDGRAARLFPDSRVNNGSAFIERGMDTALPSPTSWFRFDDQTGTEHLTIILTPKSAEAPMPAQTASDEVLYDKLKPTVSGGKGLLVETESTGSQQGTYVVRPIKDGEPVEPIIVSLALVHR